MRDRLRLLPVWALPLLIWVPLMAVVFVVGLFSQVDLRWNAVSAVVIGLVIATTCAFALKHRWRLQDEALGQVTVDFRKSAMRAAWAGPVPADPETRSAALRLAERQLQQLRRTCPIMIIGLAILLVSVVINAIVDPWRLLFSLCYVPFIVLFLMTPGRLRKRITLPILSPGSRPDLRPCP